MWKVLKLATEYNETAVATDFNSTLLPFLLYNDNCISPTIDTWLITSKIVVKDVPKPV